MSRKRGGGYGMGAPLVSIPSGPGGDWTFAVKEPINQGFDDCLFPARPGQLFNQPDPALAQAGWPLRGGRRAQRGGGLRDDDLVEDAEFYYFDLSGNEIHKHRIISIDGDNIRTVRDFGTFTQDMTIQRSTILGDDNYDTQLVILQGDHPTATPSFISVAPPSLAPATGPQLVHQNAMVFGNSNNDANTVVANSNQAGGAYDDIENSHAYRHNGWDQTLSGGSGATTWGRDTGLVQTVMAGGVRAANATRRRRSVKRGRKHGGAIDPIEASHAYPPNGWETPSTHGGQQPSWGPQTGLAQTPLAGGRRRRSTTRGRKQRGGNCGCAGSRLFGGSRRYKRQQRGGASYGYAIDPSVSIGGAGPNVDALRTPVPCDARAGSMNPINQSTGPADPRSYGIGYSLTPNTTLPTIQAGGAYSTGNAFPDSCYKAPGSQLPVYNAQTAGFNFYPSTAHNGALPDGVTPYNDVVPYAARMGGARRHRKSRKGRKQRKERKNSRK